MNISYEETCYILDPCLKEIIHMGDKSLTSWIDFGNNFYMDLACKYLKGIEAAENPMVASFLIEIIETLDGIRILYRNQCINAAFPLIRKLFETYMQVSYLLKSDSEEKSIAYEAYYISRTHKGGDEPRDIYTKYESFNKYKEIADKAYTDKKYYEWYDVYEGKKISFKKMSEKINEQKIFEIVYNDLSKNSHGLMSRDNIKNDISGKNYMREARHPGNFMKQLMLCQHIMDKLHSIIITHYKINNTNFSKECKKQKKIIKSIKMKWEKIKLV